MKSSSRSDSPKVHHVPIFVESSGTTIRPRDQDFTGRQSTQGWQNNPQREDNGRGKSTNSHFNSKAGSYSQKSSESVGHHAQPLIPSSNRGERTAYLPQEPLSPPPSQIAIPLSPPPRLEESQSQHKNSEDSEKTVIPSVIPLPAPEPKDGQYKAKPKSIPLPPPPEHSLFARPSQRSNVSGSHINIPDPGFSAFTSPSPPKTSPVSEPSPLWKTKIEVKGEPRHQATRCWVSQDEQKSPIVISCAPDTNNRSSIETNLAGASNDNQDTREKEKENMNVILAVEKIKLEVVGLVNQIRTFSGVSCEEKDYRVIDEMLTRCMLKLDKVDCLNQDRLRQTRKLAIKQVYDAISLLEAKVKENASRLNL